VPYVHVVFTLPHTLLPLTYRNSTCLYSWLFQTSAATLREVAADLRHLGAEIGVLAILHTWGQTLVRHPHVHCVVPAGGLSPDHHHWIHPKYAGFFLPVKVLSRVFRGKFVEQLRRAATSGQLDLTGTTEHLRDPAQWHAFIDALFQTDWVVYAKPASMGRQPCCGISAGTRIASPSAIIGSAPSTTNTSPFSGRTTRTRISRAR